MHRVVEGMDFWRNPLRLGETVFSQVGHDTVEPQPEIFFERFQFRVAGNEATGERIRYVSVDRNQFIAFGISRNVFANIHQSGFRFFVVPQDVIVGLVLKLKADAIQ